MDKKFAIESFKEMVHGSDYNPDQWKDYDGIVDEDIRLMDESGCNVMSLGIFSWAHYEPREGEFDFSYMDMVLDKLAKGGKKVIMATPSGARPAWMAKKYPEVMQVNESGKRILFSARHNHCYSSPVYREKVRIINEKLAERYGNHPAVIGWHLSNEYGSTCYCDLCTENFRKYLKKKFDGDIKKLNAAYWTYFWSHEFSDWDEIDPPGRAEGREYSFMGISLDWKRFCSDMQLDFVKAETEAIRKYSDLPVTTNFMDMGFKKYDYAKWAKELDFISWDNYPAWHNSDNELTAQRAAFVHDLMRSMKDKPFYLMESTPSLVNWGGVNRIKKPGMHKLASIQAVAHGADSVQYFQWRKGRGGMEKFHGAVVDHIGTNETREFKGVAEVGKTLSKLSDVVGSRTVSKVALVYDWENRMAIEEMFGFNNDAKKYVETCFEHYYPFWKMGVNIDIIDSYYDFSKYDLVVMPMLYMLKPGVEDRIEKYVAAGGNVVCTYLSFMVDENDLCFRGGFPAGKLRDVFGVWAEEIDSFYENQAVTNTIPYKGNYYKAKDMAAIIHAESAEVICKYNKDFYAGEPAVTVNNYGKGKAYYIAMRDEKGDFLKAFYPELAKELGIPVAVSEFELPYGVTAHTREDNENKYLFIENYTPDSYSFEHSGIDGEDMETGESVGEHLDIAGYGVRIIKIKK